MAILGTETANTIKKLLEQECETKKSKMLNEIHWGNINVAKTLMEEYRDAFLALDSFKDFLAEQEEEE